MFVYNEAQEHIYINFFDTFYDIFKKGIILY
jgi:hypothetical protein